jgi:hypothetical protein
MEAPLQGEWLSYLLDHIDSHGFVKKLSLPVCFAPESPGDANHTKMGDLPIKILNKERCILQWWEEKGDLWAAEGPGLPAGNF